jgi:hypothetical protein
MKRFFGVIVLIFISLVGLSATNVLVVDYSGLLSSFSDPDGIYGTIRPVDAFRNSFDKINYDDLYITSEPVFITYDFFLPADLNEFNLIIISFGFRGSLGRRLSLADQERLCDYLLSHSEDLQHSIIIEGCDFAYNYADTSALHNTYTPLASLMGLVLLDDNGPPFSTIEGQPGSIVEGLYLDYPGFGEPGPGNSPDDIAIYTVTPYSVNAIYLFDGGNKSPARGMQRRGITPGGTIPSAGAAIMMPFIFGNLMDGAFPNTKAEVLYRSIDFCISPVITIDNSIEGKNILPDSLFSVVFFSSDNVYLSSVEFYFSSDSGFNWEYIGTIPEPKADDTLFNWIVRSPATRNGIILAMARDGAGNVSYSRSGLFSVVSALDTEDRNHSGLLPDNVTLFSFPNPFNSTTTISFTPSNSFSELSILDNNGIIIKKSFVEPETNSYTWIPSEESSGVYFIRLKTSQCTYSTKFYTFAEVNNLYVSLKF